MRLKDTVSRDYRPPSDRAAEMVLGGKAQQESGTESDNCRPSGMRQEGCPPSTCALVGSIPRDLRSRGPHFTGLWRSFSVASVPSIDRSDGTSGSGRRSQHWSMVSRDLVANDSGHAISNLRRHAELSGDVLQKQRRGSNGHLQNDRRTFESTRPSQSDCHSSQATAGSA